MARPAKASPFKAKCDLELWDDSNLNNAPTRLPAVCKLYPAECGLERPYKEYIDRFRNAEKKGEREEAELALRKVSWVIINLMRVQSGMAATDKLPSQWDNEELTREGWGNDFTPCSNPLNARNNQNTISPRPGNWYRNTLLNWEIVVARLKFWEPEANPLVSAAMIDKLKNDNRLRNEALDAIKFVMEMPKDFFLKTLKDYTAALAKELTDTNAAAKKALEDLKPAVSAA